MRMIYCEFLFEHNKLCIVRPSDIKSRRQTLSPIAIESVFTVFVGK